MADLASIHPTAVVGDDVELADEVRIGAYAVIEDGVKLGRGVVVDPHAVIKGPTRIGDRTRVFTFASIGGPPQHRSHGGEGTRLEIGSDNVIREFVTINRGTLEGGGVTRVGDHNLLMAYAHVAHDCVLGDHVVLSNNATLAGHVTVSDGAVLGGMCAVQQFSRVGRLAFIAGGAMVPRDVPPFVRVVGDRARLEGLNTVGLKRGGLSPATISDLKRAYRRLFRVESAMTLGECIAQMRGEGALGNEVAELFEFIETSTRGICR